MSMGTSACFAEEITETTIRAVVGYKLYDDFIEARTAVATSDDFYPGEGSLEDFDLDTDDPTVAKFLELVDSISKKFLAETNIHISLCYHGDDCGDRYDEVAEWYWDADSSDLYAPTPALVKLRETYGKDAYKRNFYTVYG